MSLEVAAGLATLAALAFANGANDVSKSIAPLVGGCGSPGNGLMRRALLWGGLFSGLGSILALAVAGAMFKAFSQGIVAGEPTPVFALTVVAGATGWVLLSTRLGLPVSTTHAIVGATVFSAAFLFGPGAVAWGFLGPKVLLPLAVSPFMAFVITFLLCRLGLCQPAPWMARARSILLILPGASALDRKVCGRGTAIGHWGSAAAISFARGLNDAPKMAAVGFLLLPAGLPLASPLAYLVVAGAMVAGSLTWGQRVTETLAHRVTSMDCGGGLRAGLTTAALVSAGATLGAPMSTTHVSSGAIIGVGAERRRLVWPTVRSMLLAWLVTLPVAGLLAVGASVLAAVP